MIFEICYTEGILLKGRDYGEEEGGWSLRVVREMYRVGV